MYKILIVDDEVLVRVGLKSTIDWESIGFTIVGEAPNGEKAFELYKLYHPDVVITDIKMPKKDGLWLTKEIRKQDNHTPILILTCYNDFNNAREALKAGANNYILKSEVEDEELINTMLELKNALENSAKEKQLQNHEKPVELVDINSVRNELVEYLLNDSNSLEENDLKKYEPCNFYYEHSDYAVVGFFKDQIEVSNSKETMDVKNLDNAIMELINWVYTKEEIQCLIKSTDSGVLCLLAKPHLRDYEIQETIKYIKATVLQYFNITLSIVYSSVFNKVKEFSSISSKCLDRSKDLFYLGNNSILSIDDEGDKREENILKYEMKWKNILVKLIEEEDLKQCKELLSEIENQMKTLKIPVLECKLLYCNIVISIFEKYEDYNEEAEIEDKSSFNFYYNKIMYAPKIFEISKVLTALLEEKIHLLSKLRAQNSKYLINKAVEYIKENYSQKITLDDIAKHINLSKHYVSFLFKKEMGENISSHITNLRIEKSKEMILNGKYSVKDIYQKVGFTDQQYFSKTFKKNTGMTVGQYKEMVKNK